MKRKFKAMPTEADRHDVDWRKIYLDLKHTESLESSMNVRETATQPQIGELYREKM